MSGTNTTTNPMDKFQRLGFGQPRLQELEKSGWNRWWAYQLGRISTQNGSPDNFVPLYTSRTDRRYWDWHDKTMLGRLRKWVTTTFYKNDAAKAEKLYRALARPLEPIFKFFHVWSREGLGAAFSRVYDNIGRRMDGWNKFLSSKSGTTAANAATGTSAIPGGTPAAGPQNQQIQNVVDDVSKAGKKFFKMGKLGWIGVVAGLAAATYGLLQLKQKTDDSIKVHDYHSPMHSFAHEAKKATSHTPALIGGGVAGGLALLAMRFKGFWPLKLLIAGAAFLGGASLVSNAQESLHEPSRTERLQAIAANGNGYYGYGSNFNNAFNNPHHAGHMIPMDQLLAMPDSGLDSYIHHQRDLIEKHVAFKSVGFNHFPGTGGEGGEGSGGHSGH